MARKPRLPKTLLDAVRYFADENVALEFAAKARWPEGEQTCPKCGSIAKHYFLKNQRRWKCRDCRKQFSIKVGTIFEDSPLPLSKWLPAVWMLANCKNGISSYELARALGVTQKTAWFMLHRIREAMRSGSLEKLSGEVEVDETYVGGRIQNMHPDKRRRFVKAKGRTNKVPVIGLLQRTDKNPSQIHTEVLGGTGKGHVLPPIHTNVEEGSTVYTDAFQAYVSLRARFAHKAIDHAISYVEGCVHTNGIENFWSLLKRTIKGTYVAIDPFHLMRYLDEQAFRFNEREDNDGGRFLTVLESVIGRRVTYSQLTGGYLKQA